jgi:hypothetical protein
MASGFQKGKDHHLVKNLKAVQDAVLERIKSGYTIQAAMASENKKADTIRQWMRRDPDFAKALEEAKEEGTKQTFDALGLNEGVN